MFPDYLAFLQQMWGSGYESAMGLLGSASNIVVGTNPPYAAADFYAFYPKFAGLDTLPDVVVNAYISLASASLVQARWGEATWPIAMGLFVAHYVTLYLRSDGDAVYSSPGRVATAGLAHGITVSKSAGGVSAGIQPATGLEAWAAWTQTEYGVQFASMAKLVGAGPMLVW